MLSFILQFYAWKAHVQDSFKQQVNSSHVYLSQYSFHIFKSIFRSWFLTEDWEIVITSA